MKSREADLVVVGFGAERLRHQGAAVLRAHRGLHEVLWVSARERIDID